MLDLLRSLHVEQAMELQCSYAALIAASTRQSHNMKLSSWWVATLAAMLTCCWDMVSVHMQLVAIAANTPAVARDRAVGSNESDAA